MADVDTGNAPIDVIINRDRADWERQLREGARSIADEFGYSGDLYDPSDLEGVIRNFSYRQHHENGLDPKKFIDDQLGIYRTRAASNRRPGGQAGASGGLPALPGNQFDDAYSSMLENISKAQMGQVRSNPGLDNLTAFLNKRFTELSTTPGYSADERALLNTQAFEPIEANRQASIRRAQERAAARGFAPSSGLMELDIRDLERAADQQRTVANRDLAIAGLNRRDQDLNQALNIGRMLGLEIPGGQRAEELQLANILYQMPRTALQDALSVLNGSGSGNDLFNQIMQMTQENRYRQQNSDANNAAMMQQIGSILAALFGGRR